MNLFLILFFLFFLSFLFPSLSLAVCPLCTVAVGAGLGISRFLGIDDVITGIWMGGLIVSGGLWFSDWMSKKGWKIPYSNALSILLFFAFVIIPLYWSKVIGVAGNVLWGIDKLLLGTILGSLVFLLGVGLDKIERRKNNGKVFIYYQKVILPVFLLSLVSFIFYFLVI